MMKRILALVSLLTIAAACATQPSGNKDVTANANTGSAMKSTAAAPSESDIIAKEKAGWDAFKRKDADAFKKMLAPDYIEVLDSGTMDTAASIAGMKDYEINDVTFADWKMTTIDKDAVLITYTVNVKGSYKGQPIPAGPYREASAYVNRNGEWLGIYYQETLTQTAPPPPPPTSTPKPAASAMAKPADAGPDAAANEKLVWDALKSKNYDGFASYLASDSMEIEADGVYDKAGSVKGVSGFDFSKAELSDWKTVKFDNDASLVTYKVKVPGMKPVETGYHSTIWVNRDGKWQALFHMGTPAATETPAAPEKKM